MILASTVFEILEPYKGRKSSRSLIWVLMGSACTNFY